LRGYLHEIKRYPSSREARQTRPVGTVGVWIELDRGGRLVNAGVESSSGSMLLDQEALRTVRTGSYQPFPTDIYPGQNAHRFVMQLEYVLSSGG